MKSRPTLIHLQMGQDVLYVVLSFFVIVTVVLAVIITGHRPQSHPAKHAAVDLRDCLKLLATGQDDLHNRAKPPGSEFGATDQFIIQRLIRCERLLAQRQRNIDKRLAQPPIITLREADGYFFPSGSAVLSEGFKNRIREIIIPKLAALGAQYNAHIIEVIGLTDEQPVRGDGAQSTMDADLLPFVHGSTDEAPTAVDNVGLGMARAAAVVQVLKTDSRLAQYEILPFSGGQAIDLGDRLAAGTEYGKSVEERRRIEIRLRRPRSPS